MTVEQENVKVAEEVKPMQFTIAQLVPWLICFLVVTVCVTYMLTNRGGNNVSPSPAPSPLNDRVAQLDKILTFDEGQYLSSVCNNLAMFIAQDGSRQDGSSPVLTSTKDITQTASAMGLIITLDHGPYTGLGAVTATYFDDESEVAQDVRALTAEDRVKASKAWQALAEDLAKVQ